MISPVTKTIISISIALSLVSSQIILPLQASADNTFLDYDNPNKNGNNPYKISFSGVVSSGLLMSVVGCTGIVNKVSKISTEFISDLLLRKTERLAKKAAKKAADAADKIVDTAQQAVTATAVAAPGVPAADVGTRGQKVAEGIAKTAHNLALSAKEYISSDDIDAALKRNEDKLRQANFREECINGIAVQLAKNQLTSMTKYTMNWINTGFNGDPFFVRNVDSFMSSIEDQILQKEINLFKNPANLNQYPYGRSFAQSAIGVNQSAKNFADTMKQDLTDYLIPGSTAKDFSGDFSRGGWDGWFALTQHDNNNPLGFTIMQSQHLVDEQARTVQNTKDELVQNGGYLSQKKCVEYYPYDPIKDANNPINSSGNRLRCAKYEAVTPGSTIRDKVSTYINSPERQLELVKTLNDALNALFSALINKFENQGLASLRSSANNYTSTTTGGLGSNQIFDTLGNLISGGTGTGTGIPSIGGSFDLTRDLGNTYTASSGSNNNWTIDTRGVLQIQYDYVGLVNKSKAVVANVMPTLGKLDYCIPGPNQNWRANALENINTYLDNISSNPNPPIDPSTIETSLDNYEIGINSTYGISSPMQDSSLGNTKYLKMSLDGLTITSDMNTYAETINEANDSYRAALTESNTNIAKLNVIKNKVNKIVADAQARRATKRAAAGLPRVGNACLTKEKVTYLDNGVIK